MKRRLWKKLYSTRLHQSLGHMKTMLSKMEHKMRTRTKIMFWTTLRLMRSCEMMVCGRRVEFEMRVDEPWVSAKEVLRLRPETEDARRKKEKKTARKWV
jgi:hypothetical protein